MLSFEGKRILFKMGVTQREQRFPYELEVVMMKYVTCQVSWWPVTIMSVLCSAKHASHVDVGACLTHMW